MSLDFLERFLPLLTARTGLHVREKDRPGLARALETRLRESGMPADEYLRELERDAALTGEWKRLMPRLTNGESYFLRDKGQISLLRDRLLPELIATRKDERTLRVWSAGCSTGEEPYTLAMLINELLPQRADWQISILGTDINEAALERANAGVYGAWAFRSVPDEVRTRYFRETAAGLEIKPELRRLVKFSPLNLRGTGYPNRANGLFDIDLLLCRNVLIYFDRDAVSSVLRSFAATLRAGGYLLTGHAELAGLDPAPLAVRTFAESVAYQKQALSIVGGTLPARTSSMLRGTGQKPGGTVGGLASPRPSNESPRGTPSPSPSPLPAPPRAPEASPAPGAAKMSVAEMCDSARLAANGGRYEEAVTLCRRAIAADAVNIDAYALWARVTDEQSDAAQAKNLWKKVIYLAPSHIEAYVELGALYHREGDERRARQQRETALALLRAPAGADESRSRVDAAEVEALTRHLEEMLGAPPGATAPKADQRDPDGRNSARRRG